MSVEQGWWALNRHLIVCLFIYLFSGQGFSVWPRLSWPSLWARTEIHLTLLPECWDYWCELPCPSHFCFNCTVSFFNMDFLFACLFLWSTL